MKKEFGIMDCDRYEVRKLLAAAKQMLKDKKVVTGTELKRYLDGLSAYYAIWEEKMKG